MLKSRETYILLSETPIIIKKIETSLRLNSTTLQIDLFSDGLKTLTNTIEIVAMVPIYILKYNSNEFLRLSISH